MKTILIEGDLNEFCVYAKSKGCKIRALWDSRTSLPHLAEVESEDSFDLLQDPPEDLGWRYGNGTTLGEPDLNVICNGKKLKAWKEYHNSGYRYKDLEDFMNNGQPSSTPRNVAAVLSGLAADNNLSLLEFYQRYARKV